jgi:type II secretory ATPase GspE/PulE/Tfp pilus assembly ATPase PilB-like protein
MDFLQTLPMPAALPSSGSAFPLVVGQSAFVLVSWWKVVILIAPFLAWGWLVSNVFDKHADRFHLGQEKWGSIHLVLGLLAVVVAFGMPIPEWWGFLVGFIAAVAILAADVVAFVTVANKDERIPEEHHLRLDLSALSEGSAKRKAAKQAATVSLKISGPKGLVNPPEREIPEYQVRAEAEGIYIKARDNRASRIIINARQGEGSGAEFIIDGVRHPGESLSAPQAKAIIDFWKAAAGLDVKDVRRRLAGEITVVRDEIKSPVRLVSIGQSGGLKLTMQVEPAKSVQRKAADLGFTDEQMKVVEGFVNTRGGVVLLGGVPMGGRTTTFYSVTQMHDAYTSNVQTIETEPMAQLEGIRQITFDPTGADEYSKIVRSNLRRDPDVLSVEELPDTETAREIVNADLERSRVYVTLNTDSAMKAVQMWVKAVGDPKLAAKGLQGVITQRLVRQLCGNCRVPYQPPADLLKKLNLPAQIQQLYKKGGQVLVKNKPEVCPVCNGTGYEAQMGVFEVFPIGSEERACIANQDWNGLKTEMRKRKLPTVQQVALRRAAEGMTSIEEVTRLSAKPSGGSGSSTKGKPAPAQG